MIIKKMQEYIIKKNHMLYLCQAQVWNLISSSRHISFFYSSHPGPTMADTLPYTGYMYSLSH